MTEFKLVFPNKIHETYAADYLQEHILEGENHLHEDSGLDKAEVSVWIFRQEVDISTVILQPLETCNAIWASQKQIKHMIDEGTFTGFSYIDELFEYVS